MMAATAEPQTYHWDLIEVLAALVQQGRADGQKAKVAVARQDWRAVCKLIKACTTTKELREMQP